MGKMKENRRLNNNSIVVVMKVSISYIPKSSSEKDDVLECSWDSELVVSTISFIVFDFCSFF